KQCEIAVAIDERALQESGIDADKVQFSKRLKQLSLQDALALLLPEHELGWTVHGGVLLITSRSETEMAMEVRVYPIRGLGSRPEASPRLQYTEAYETLPELITSVIALTTWADVGAAGAAKVVPSAAALVVSQTAEVHEEIAAYLAGLRKFRADHPLEPAGESEASPGEDELVLFKYNIPSDLGWDTEAAPPAKAGDKTASGAAAQPSTAETQTQTRKVPASLATRERIANQFAAALPRLVEPESWQAGGGEGTIEVVSDLLYIRQRMAIHGRIATFLQPAVSWPAPVAPRIAPMGAGGGQF
ncbi:MAG TPA: hypothetical protein VHY20_11005, partial [Pirellulales bacterium]|nr:hypothetical protein [Pirellulales bacterium]